jgi:hypothetical protein
MEAKTGVEIEIIHDKKDANQKKMDGGQEDLKAQVGSLASGIGVKQEGMMAMAGEMQSIAVPQKFPKEDAAVKTIRGLKD